MSNGINGNTHSQNARDAGVSAGLGFKFCTSGFNCVEVLEVFVDKDEDGSARLGSGSSVAFCIGAFAISMSFEKKVLLAQSRLSSEIIVQEVIISSFEFNAIKHTPWG